VPAKVEIPPSASASPGPVFGKTPLPLLYAPLLYVVPVFVFELLVVEAAFVTGVLLYVTF
jgi:hypothetical protein